MKKVILIGVILSLIIVYSIFTLNNSNTNKYELSLKENKDLAVYVYDNEVDNYVNQNSFPIGDYTLNTTLSGCIGGGSITGYDNTNGIVNFNLIAGDACSVYFDELPSCPADLRPVITTAPPGTIYLRPSAGATTAEATVSASCDNSIIPAFRVTGASFASVLDNNDGTAIITISPSTTTASGTYTVNVNVDCICGDYVTNTMSFITIYMID